MPGLTCVCLPMPGHTWVCLPMPGHTGICLLMPGHNCVCLPMQGHTCVCLLMPGHTCVWLSMPGLTSTYLTFNYFSLTHLDQGEVADKENIVDRQLDMTCGEATIRHRHGIVRDKGLITSQEARGAVEVQAVGVIEVDRGTQSCDYALWGLKESHGCRLTTQLSSEEKNWLYVSTHSMDGLH